MILIAHGPLSNLAAVRSRTDTEQTPPPGRRPRGRRPGTGSAREDVLRAARSAFAELGFNAATVRGIAARASVDPALVLQFFGSKEQLFAAAMELPFDSDQVVARILDGPRAQIGSRMLATFLEMWDSPEAGPRMVALIRSASTHERAADRLREIVVAEILEPVAAALDAPDARLRAALAGSQLVGLGFTRYVLGLEPLASASPAELDRQIAPAIQRYLTGRL
jgi:AcrR family transcriptional regulator